MEHYDHADNSGRHAALNMTGARKAYNYMPMFWGAMNGTPYEAVGLIDSRLDTVGVWQRGERLWMWLAIILICEQAKTRTEPSTKSKASIRRASSII